MLGPGALERAGFGPNYRRLFFLSPLHRSPGFALLFLSPFHALPRRRRRGCCGSRGRLLANDIGPSPLGTLLDRRCGPCCRTAGAQLSPWRSGLLDRDSLHRALRIIVVFGIAPVPVDLASAGDFSIRSLRSRWLDDAAGRPGSAGGRGNLRAHRLGGFDGLTGP